jgi:hypothetical protein
MYYVFFAIVTEGLSIIDINFELRKVEEYFA